MNSKQWAFLSSHGLVFVYVIRYPDSTNREIALAVGLTEQTVHRILRNLEEEGYLIKTRTGRRTSYTVNPKAKVRHPLEQDIQLQDFLQIIARKRDGSHQLGALPADGSTQQKDDSSS